jgi:hypothetical protein
MTAAPASRIPVDVAWRVVGAKGRTLRIDLYAGAVLQDRVTQVVGSDDERVVSRLSGAATGVGVSRFTVRVRDDATEDPALEAEGSVTSEAAPVRWRVLIVDSRPSWASTFVRRALEDDRRFDVASRVSTSRGIAVESGRAPARLEPAALESFDAVIVGAPDALVETDVRALESFARGRGGAVVLLMDRAVSGAFARLTGARSFRDVHSVERRKLSGDAGVMIATELALPEGLSPGAESLAASGAAATSTPAVWQTPLGAGRVVVSGALDAWRYRTREQNGFARFWTAVVSEAAASAPAAVTVIPAARAVVPGATVDVRVLVRRAQLSEAARPAPVVEARARIVSDVAAEAAEPLRLWPTAERGVFVAPVRVPNRRGTYRIVADAFDAAGSAIGSASAEIVAGDGARVTSTVELAAWTTSRGGVVMPAARLADAGAMARVRESASAAPVRVHPMRSPWWLPIFIGALGGEWWLRRRRGER